ncbi:WG repeat-containing protein [Ruminococcus sp.]|uniref:WG repeat-containing protein n=1 Tax=Ruminococcus sp. TaxID=41978 RepID=UPI002E81EF4A|nr:WG repeat-containing protein [Ruminococcus sp.]MEE3492910.1 WG repeat-containing protein [Ruminococcus sp.]
MKTTNKLFALILAAVMTVSLAACSKKPAGAPAPNAQNSTAASKKKLDLATTKFEKASRFSEGLAWVTNLGSSTVIDKEGNTIYQTEFKIYNDCADFKDGVSWFRDKDDYFIIDKEGKILYQTKSNTNDEFERILAYGDGSFLTLRHTTGFNKNEYSLGAIDKDGKETGAFQTIEEYSLGAKWRYAGDGLFFNAEGEVYDVISGKYTNYAKKQDKTWQYINGEAYDEEFRLTPQNGKMWIPIRDEKEGDCTAIFDLHSGELIKKIPFVFGYGRLPMFGTICVCDGVYYDLTGEEIAKVDLYKDQVIDRGEFLEDHQAYLIVKDKNQDSYITYVNKSGEQLFEPMKITTNRFKAQNFIHGFNFAMMEKDSNTVIIYDSYGKEAHRIENISNNKDHTIEALDDDYVIIDGQYYFF